MGGKNQQVPVLGVEVDAEVVHQGSIEKERKKLE